ncbi:MAG: hypothetical protein DMF29_11825, partial [Verrucomicrobia bacterium]
MSIQSALQPCCYLFRIFFVDYGHALVHGARRHVLKRAFPSKPIDETSADSAAIETVRSNTNNKMKIAFARAITGVALFLFASCAQQPLSSIDRSKYKT